jgi:hypothetical protein
MRRDMLTRDQILASELPDELVDVPEWGGKVRVRGLSAEDMEKNDRSLMEQGQDGTYRPKSELPLNMNTAFVVRCVVNDDGTPMFSEEDVEVLAKKSGAAIQRVWKVARRLSGRGDEEELAAAFAAAQNGSSSSE